jgi:hypothetical protein
VPIWPASFLPPASASPRNTSAGNPPCGGEEGRV